MLSKETLRKLCELLLVISEGERLIEVNRQLLSFQIDLRKLFKVFDVNQKGFVDLNGLDLCLKKNGQIEDIDAIKMLLLFYDKDKRNEIAYDDFSNMILSTHPTSKRVMRTNCNSTANYSNSNIINANANSNAREDKELNILLMNCMGKELQLAKDVRNLIDPIKRQYDFNIDHLFSALSDALTHNITKESLERFFKSLNAIYDWQDIEPILHRLDINKDSIVNFNDFAALFSFPSCRPYKHDISLHPSKLCEQPSFVKQISPSLILRKAPSNHSHYCALDDDEDNYKERAEDLFLEYFKLLIAKEKTIEKAKIDLMIRPDFNINDAFRLINSNSTKGFLFISDIELYFAKINHGLNAYELKLINKRCDLIHKGYISYADLFDFLAPFETDYRKILEERSNDEQEGSMHNFSEGTTLLIIKLVSIIIESEKLINGYRTTRIKSNKRYLIDLFRSICKNNIEMFTTDELASFLKQKGVFANDMEISLLYIRLDRNRTGKVELFELDDEFTYLF